MLISILHWLELLLLPPGLILSMLLLGWFLTRRSSVLGLTINLSAILLLLLLSMPLVARQLLSNLQSYPAIQRVELNKEQSDRIIVILGGGRYSVAPEYDYRDEISPLTLERLRYAATIAKKLDLPILLSGGRRNSNATSEAVIMNQVMINVFNIAPLYLEINATNTHHQAFEVKKLLAEHNISKIYLLTHAWHMKRAVAEFSAHGLDVQAAPMGFAATSQADYGYMPSATALASSSRAMHEYYGLFYLWLTH